MQTKRFRSVSNGDAGFFGRRIKMIPSIEDLINKFIYIEESGDLVKRCSGKVMGSITKKGRKQVFINGKTFLAHRVIWAMLKGQWPKGEIDHIDMNPLNNKISNLRDVSKRINQQNRKNATSHNRSGILGVRKTNNSYYARIVIDGKQVHLGAFKSPLDAQNCYLAAKRKYHIGCTI